MRVTQKQLAEFFGVTPRTIRRWEGRGMPREDDGTYRTSDCVKWRVETAEADLQAELEDVPPRSESRAKIDHLRARRDALDLAEREGDLITRDAFEEAVAAILDRVRAGLLNMPGRWATSFPGTPPDEAQPVLRKAANDLLEELSGPVADELEGGQAGDDPPPLSAA